MIGVVGEEMTFSFIFARKNERVLPIKAFLTVMSKTENKQNFVLVNQKKFLINQPENMLTCCKTDK